MLDAVSMFSDELMEAILEEQVDRGADPRRRAQGHARARADARSSSARPTRTRACSCCSTPSTHYLPSPTDVENDGRRPRQRRGADRARSATPTKPLVALAFKLEDGRYGQLTYMRIYQGTLAQGRHASSTRRTGQQGQGRPPRAHARRRDGRHRRAPAPATSSRCSASTAPRATPSPTARSDVAMTSMHVPDAGHLARRSSRRTTRPQDNMAKALSRFTKEDPTFRVARRPESRARPSSPAWASCTSTSTSSA